MAGTVVEGTGDVSVGPDPRGKLGKEAGAAGDRRLSVVAWSGFGAVAIYLFAVILGGLLDPSYSHLRHPVSELISSHAPDRWLVGGFFMAYNLALLVFAVGLYLTGRRSRALGVALAFLIAIALGGILLVAPFPQDSLGQPGTGAGAMHIALAAVVSPLTVATAFLLGFAFRRDASWRGASRFSVAMGLVILATGATAAITAVSDSAYLGLFERLTIGAFLVWVLGVGAHARVTVRRRREHDA